MTEEHNSSTVSQDKADNVDLIFDYVVNNIYASGMSKNDKSNLRKLSKPYVARTGKLYYRSKEKKDGNSGNEHREVLVIRDRDEQRRIIKSIHMGSSDDNNTARCLGNHLGIIRTRIKILERFYWKNLGKDVKEFILACDHCQKVNLDRKVDSKIDVDHVRKINVGELHPAPVPSEVMAQIGVNITNLPKTVDGYCCIVVAVDYFSKWPEARPLKDRTAENVAKFLFEDIICRHGCVKIQINDQGREFIYKVSAELHRLTGAQQQITSAFHPQANGLLKRQNRTIKESFIKSLEDRSNWVECLPAVLFAYRTAKHSSTKMTPFQIVYNRQAVLPIELQLNQISKAYIDDCQVKAASSGKQKKKVKEDGLDHCDSIRAPDPSHELNRNDPSSTKDSYDHEAYAIQLEQDAGLARTNLISDSQQQDPTDHSVAASPFTSHPISTHHPPSHMPPSHPPPSHPAPSHPPPSHPPSHIPPSHPPPSHPPTSHPPPSHPPSHIPPSHPPPSHPPPAHPPPSHPPSHIPTSHPPPSHSFNTSADQPSPPSNEPLPHSQPLPFSTSVNSNYSNQNLQYTFPQPYGRPLLWHCNSHEWNIHKNMH